jgi:hypothetical protein
MFETRCNVVRRKESPQRYGGDMKRICGGTYECCYLIYLYLLRVTAHHHVRVEDTVSLLKEQSSRLIFRWSTMHIYIYHHIKAVLTIIRCYDDIQTILASIEVST